MRTAAAFRLLDITYSLSNSEINYLMVTGSKLLLNDLSQFTIPGTGRSLGSTFFVSQFKIKRAF